MAVDLAAQAVVVIMAEDRVVDSDLADWAAEEVAAAQEG